jgi:hypothetical protein
MSLRKRKKSPHNLKVRGSDLFPQPPRVDSEAILLKSTEQTNRSLQVVAIVTTVFLPASLVAGIFAMNVAPLSARLVR